MPSDVTLALCLSTIDRLSAQVPEIVSTSELEALRTAVRDATDFDATVIRLAEAEQTIKMVEIEDQQAIDNVADELQAEVKRLRDLFLYDAPIGSAIVLLRDAVAGRTDDMWRDAAGKVLAEVFKYAPSQRQTEEPDIITLRELPPLEDARIIRMLERNEEAAATYRIPGEVALKVDMAARTAMLMPSYYEIDAIFQANGVSRETSRLACDLIFMQDGDPDAKIYIEDLKKPGESWSDVLKKEEEEDSPEEE